MIIRLEMENYNIIFTEKQRISAVLPGKIDKYECLTGEEILPPDQSQMLEHAKITYSPLGKALDKQKKNRLMLLKSLNLSNKIYELKQMEVIFPKNQLNDLIIDKLKEIMQLRNNIKLDDLEYTAKRGNIIISVNTLYLLFF